MHITISYPLSDDRLLTQLFTALDKGAINVDMISQIVNVEGLQLSFSIKDSDIHQISDILENLSVSFSALDYKINETYVKISLIGSGMRDMSGVASKAFITLINAKIPFTKQPLLKLAFLMSLMHRMVTEPYKHCMMHLKYRICFWDIAIF